MKLDAYIVLQRFESCGDQDHIGAFSELAEAKAASQADWDEACDANGDARSPLEWSFDGENVYFGSAPDDDQFYEVTYKTGK